MLPLSGYLNKLQQGNLTPKASRGSRFVGAFTIATLISGVNWYLQNQMLSHQNDKETKLIHKVANNTSNSQFTQSFNLYQADAWNCTKVTLDGYLEQGRFVVKKTRNGEEGYMVFAPFVIQRSHYQKVAENPAFNRKLALNLGWIPKRSKHVVNQTVGSDVVGENTYTQDPITTNRLNKLKGDNLPRGTENEDLYVPITTVTAYVRLGEKQNKARGYTNWLNYSLFKFIDLSIISRAFRAPNFDEASTVYLDRTSQGEDQNLPMPITKEQLISDIKNDIEWDNQQAKSNIQKVFGVTYLASILIALI